jgi:hypothetical protein
MPFRQAYKKGNLEKNTIYFHISNKFNISHVYTTNNTPPPQKKKKIDIRKFHTVKLIAIKKICYEKFKRRQTMPKMTPVIRRSS